MADPITIYSLSDSAVDNAGGRLFRILGDFAGQFGFEYAVHVGPLGTTADPKAYSGKAGQNTKLTIWNEGELRCYLPRLESGGKVSVLVRRADGAREQLLVDVLDVVPRQYFSGVFELRGVLPPYYLTGPRSLENVRPA